MLNYVILIYSVLRLELLELLKCIINYIYANIFFL
jgi:hypothetical protein